MNVPMSVEMREQLREVVRLAGRLDKASELVGVSKNTIARSLAGLPQWSVTLAYLNGTIPRVLSTLQRGPSVDRTG